MASDQEPAPHPFDAKTVEHLIGLMAQHDLAEITLQDGDQRIRLRKGGPVAAPAPVAYAAPQAPPPPAPPGGQATPSAPVAATPAKKLHEIKSPMVGTFYLRPKPDAADFVKPGQALKADTTVCLIEAMKIFNDIKAEVAGTVAEVCVRNGDSVDYGAVLFRVDTGA